MGRINNCVGVFNLKLFLLFIGYTLVACLWAGRTLPSRRTGYSARASLTLPLVWWWGGFCLRRRGGTTRQQCSTRLASV